MKLLLVDDEEYVIESIKRNLDLTETGVSEVYTAFSVQQAKNIMGMVDIDIVISDIVMPGGTGFDFVEWVRKEGKREAEMKTRFLATMSHDIRVPAHIQMEGYDAPQYANVQYPWELDRHRPGELVPQRQQRNRNR